MASGFLCEGDLYIATITGGVESGLEGPFEVNKFETKANVEKKEQTSKARGKYGQVTASVSLGKPAELNIEFGAVDKTVLGYALLGTESVLSQPAGTAASETTVARLDRWVRLARRSINVFTSLTNSLGTVTYVQGTDYIVDKQMGAYKALVGGAITEGQSLRANYTYLASNGAQIAGATKTQIKARLLLIGNNLVDGLPVEVEVFEAVIASSAAVDFMSSDFAKVPVGGSMVTPTGKTQPFEVRLLAAA